MLLYLGHLLVLEIIKLIIYRLYVELELVLVIMKESFRNQLSCHGWILKDRSKERGQKKLLHGFTPAVFRSSFLYILLDVFSCFTDRHKNGKSAARYYEVMFTVFMAVLKAFYLSHLHFLTREFV